MWLEKQESIIGQNGNAYKICHSSHTCFQHVSHLLSPCINLLRAKYRVRGNWLAHQISSSSSPIWRSISGTKQIISRGACILVGNGNFIRIWNDPWILDLPQFIPRLKEDANIDNALIVSQLLRQDRCNWDTKKLRELFDDDTIVHI